MQSYSQALHALEDVQRFLEHKGHVNDALRIGSVVDSVISIKISEQIQTTLHQFLTEYNMYVYHKPTTKYFPYNLLLKLCKIHAIFTIIPNTPKYGGLAENLREKDNLSTRAKRSATKVSLLQRFDCMCNKLLVINLSLKFLQQSFSSLKLHRANTI